MTVKLGWVGHHDQATNPVYTNDLEHSTRCVSFWNGVRNWHIQHNGWSDIAYSFGICRHGVLFEGRGWSKAQFAGGADQKGTGYHDSEWYSVLFFLGDGEVPTEQMLDRFKALRAESIERGQAGRQVIGHNTFRIKECPGPILTEWLAELDNTDPTEDDMDARQLAAALGAAYNEQTGQITVPLEDGTPGVTTQVPLAVALAYVHTELRRGRAGGWWPSPSVQLSADVGAAVAEDLAKRLED